MTHIVHLALLLSTIVPYQLSALRLVLNQLLRMEHTLAPGADLNSSGMNAIEAHEHETSQCLLIMKLWQGQVLVAKGLPLSLSSNHRNSKKWKVSSGSEPG